MVLNPWSLEQSGESQDLLRLAGEVEPVSPPQVGEVSLLLLHQSPRPDVRGRTCPGLVVFKPLDQNKPESSKSSSRWSVSVRVLPAESRTESRRKI